MPRMISCPCSPSFRELSVANGALFIYNLFSPFHSSGIVGFLQLRLIFPRICTRHHASTLRPNTGSKERRYHMPTCIRPRFLREDSSSTRNKRRIHPERIQDANC